MKINFLILSTALFLFACQSESNKQEAKVTVKQTENTSETQIPTEINLNQLGIIQLLLIPWSGKTINPCSIMLGLKH